MSDDLNKRGAADRNRVNVHEDHELYYWTKKFGVTPAELESAVKAVGPMASDVEAYFKTGSASRSKR